MSEQQPAPLIAITLPRFAGTVTSLITIWPPVMTIDADFLEEDRDLRATYLGTDNYLMGVKMAEEAMKLKPEGGTVCLQLGNVAADNINARAAGTRDTLSGKKGIDRLKGENGWTEINGCPVFTNDQADLANQQMADTFTANPKLDAFILEGGWAQFAPQAYAQVTDQVMARLKAKDLIIIAGDTREREPRREEILTIVRSALALAQRQGLGRGRLRHVDGAPQLGQLAGSSWPQRQGCVAGLAGDRSGRERRCPPYWSGPKHRWRVSPCSASHPFRTASEASRR